MSSDAAPVRQMMWSLLMAGSAWAVARQTALLRNARRRGRQLAQRATAFEAAPRQAQRRVLLLGDSTGLGVGARRPQESLPGLLHAAFPQAQIVNRCHNGARVADLLRQARAVRAQAKARGVDGPCFDVVLVLAGGNDVLHLTPLRGLEDDARALLHTLRGLARHVVWMGSADVGGSPVLRAPLNWLASWRTARTMQRLARTARAEGATFIDFSRERRFGRDTDTYFAADGVHPSSASYRWCFEVLYRSVPLHAWLATAPADDPAPRATSAA